MEKVNEKEESIEKRPGILIIGSPNVGKRTILSRLVSADVEDASDSSSELLVQGWTIDTKYYSANVSIWMAHLHEGFSFGSMPSNLAALVMVFDMSELSSLAALKKWVSRTDIQRFDILLCVGNKVDLVPGHPAHDEYKRHLRRPENVMVSSDADFSDYGISETDGSSLLGNDEPSGDIRQSCSEWFIERNIEYVEACASNVDFDKCLSVDGDSQGVERILGALTAHMWPGMVLKSGNRILAPILPEKQESSEEDSDYEADYEVLSKGSMEDPWDDTDEGWVSAHSAGQSSTGPNVLNTASEVIKVESSTAPSVLNTASEVDKAESSVGHTEINIVERAKASDSEASVSREDLHPEVNEVDGKGAHLELDDLDQMMSEIVNVRNSSRLMPDFQRREMAAKLAMKMAAMFGGDSSGDEAFE